jgi:hypothetical protein
MLITPDTPDWSARGGFKHGSNLNGNLCPSRVTSQRKSTPQALQSEHLPVFGAFGDHHLQRLATRERDRVFTPVDAIQKPDAQHVVHILPARAVWPLRTLRPPGKGARQKLFQILVARKTVLGRMRAIGGPIGEIAIVLPLRPFGSGGIDLTRIEPSPGLLVLQQIVCGRNRLELLLGTLVTRMQVRMAFARQLLERILDILLACSASYPEDLVRIYHIFIPLRSCPDGRSNRR